MDRPTIIPADPVAAAEMAEQEANMETAQRDPKQPYPENPGLTDDKLAEQNDRTGRVPPNPSDVEAAQQRGRTA